MSTNASGGKLTDMRYYPYGETRSGTLATDRRYTGQRHESGLGLYDYNARFYDPALGRFIQADSIVPGAASGSGGGAATLGYDSNTRLTPLTVNLGEFAAQVNAENREVLQFGAFFQWDGKTRQEHNVPVGPANPQALNRYAYCLNNPLRYVDPTGHWNFELELTAEQAQAIIDLDKWLDTIDAIDIIIGTGVLGTLEAVAKYAKVFPTHEQNIAQITTAIETVRAVNPSVAGAMAWLVSPEAAIFGGILAAVGAADLGWTKYDIGRLADALGEIQAGVNGDTKNGATLSLKGCGIYRITATNQNGSASFTTAVIGPWGSLVVPIIGTTAIYR